MALKKQTLAFIYFLVLLPLVSHGQYNTKLYNRLMKLNSETKSDSEKLKVILQLAHYHTEQSFLNGLGASKDTALVYLQQADKIAARLNSNWARAETMLEYAKRFELQLDYPLSMSYSKKAIDLFHAIKDDKGEAKAYIMYFAAYRYAESPEETAKLAKKIVDFCLKSGDNVLTGKAYENLAESRQMAQAAEVLGYLDKSLHYYTLGGKKEVQSVYSFYANIYTRMGEHTKALMAITKAIDIIEKYEVENYYNMTIYVNAGLLYLSMENPEKALLYANKAFIMLNRYASGRYLIIISRLLCTTHTMLKNKEKTLEYLPFLEEAYINVKSPFKEYALATLLEFFSVWNVKDKAEKYAPEAFRFVQSHGPETPYYEHMCHAIGKYAYMKGDYELARKNIHTSIAFINKMSGKNRLHDAYMLLYRMDSIQGRQGDALRNYDIAIRYKDSIFNQAKNWQLTELEVRYGTAQKNKDNLLLKQQAQLKESQLSKSTIIKNISIAGAILLAIAAMLIYRRYRITQRLRKVISAKNERLELLLNEKEFLIEEKDWLLKEIHHRVKNNLQVVMSLLNTQSYFLNDQAAKDAIKNSQHRIHSMSLIHKKLYQSDNIATVNMSVYFQELVEYYKIAFDTEGQIRFELSVEPVELDSSMAVPIGLILNEAINNALKHAFPNHRKGVISIRLESTDENTFVLSIKDNGVGIKGDISISDFSSLGMKLIRGFCGEINAGLELSGEDGLSLKITFKYSGRTADTPEIAQAS